MSRPTEENRDATGRPDTNELDAAAVRRTLAGELAAFDELVNRYQKRAVSVAYRLVGNTHDAMEIAQDAFLRAFRSLRTLKEPGRFGPWLVRIVSNLSLNHRRSRRLWAHAGGLPEDDMLEGGASVRTAEGETSAAAGEWSLDEAASSEMATKVRQAIDELPEKQRLALILFAIEGWPQRDVAEVLECSLETVKWNVFQARKTLKTKLAEYL